MKPIIALLIILVVVVIGVLYFFFVNQEKKTEEPITPTPIVQPQTPDIEELPHDVKG